MPLSPKAKHCTCVLPDLRHFLKATTSAGSANEEALTTCTFSSARAPCAAARTARGGNKNSRPSSHVFLPSINAGYSCLVIGLGTRVQASTYYSRRAARHDDQRVAKAAEHVRATSGDRRRNRSSRSRSSAATAVERRTWPPIKINSVRRKIEFIAENRARAQQKIHDFETFRQRQREQKFWAERTAYVKRVTTPPKISKPEPRVLVPGHAAGLRAGRKPSRMQAARNRRVASRPLSRIFWRAFLGTPSRELCGLTSL